MCPEIDPAIVGSCPFDQHIFWSFLPAIATWGIIPPVAAVIPFAIIVPAVILIVESFIVLLIKPAVLIT